MENLMDKLAQRWNAQEIMKANMAAETRELEQLRSRVKEYEECLSQMRSLCEEMQKASSSMEQQAKKVSAQMEQQLRENVSVTERLLKERIEYLSEEAIGHLAETEAGISESIVRLQELEEKQPSQEWLQESIAELTTHIDDVVHKENVKVYRNVQAVVMEETTKQTGELKDAVGGLAGKLSAVLGVSIAALLLSGASLAFLLLTYFHIL